VAFTRGNGHFERNRSRQNRYWMRETIDAALRASFFTSPAVEASLRDYEHRVETNRITSFVAAKELLEKYFSGMAEGD
jgi:LAO/AO transport system kinase